MEEIPSQKNQKEEQESLSAEDAQKLFSISNKFRKLGQGASVYEVENTARELVSQGLLSGKKGFYVFDVPRSEEYPDGYVKILDIQSSPDFNTGHGRQQTGYFLSTYDEAGRPLTTEDHDSNGAVHQKSMNEYYPSGIKKRVENHTIRHDAHWVESYDFDEDGTQLRRESVNLRAKKEEESQA